MRAKAAFDEAAHHSGQAEKLSENSLIKPADELANVRAVAKEWLAAIIALFGLFSLAGIIFARDALSEVDTLYRLAVGVNALLPICCAAASVFFGHRAAHGWPRRPDASAESQGVFRTYDYGDVEDLVDQAHGDA